MRIVEFVSPAQIAEFCALHGSYPIAPEDYSVRQADAHWGLVDHSGMLLARCSLWWHEVPDYPGERLGLIGHYAATMADGAQAARDLLRHACAELAWQGCSLAVGPLDGSTFRHYRLLTGRQEDGVDHPPFFLEPDNPDAWPTHFEAADFSPLAGYFSALGPLPEDDPRLELLQAKADSAGIRIRPVAPDDFAAELQKIFSVVLRSFQSNYLSMPVAEDEFIAQYGAILPFVRPELVLIAEKGLEAVGFVFAVPDLAQAQRGEAVDSVIVKTVAVVPEMGGMGLGGLLVGRCQQAARRLGLTKMVHALMYDDNVSRKISLHYAKPMRRYTLYGCRL